MKIANIKLRNQTVLAPMSKVTSIPFRLLCKKYGCGLVFSEMINANAIIRNNKATLRKVVTCDEEKPVTMQLFGTKEDVLLKAAEKLHSNIIDIKYLFIFKSLQYIVNRIEIDAVFFHDV